MAKTSTLRPIDEWEMAPNRPQTLIRLDVSVGSKPEVAPLKWEVRSTLRSGHRQAVAPCPLVPDSDSCTAAMAAHSITSSARNSRDCGIVRPSDLAVFKLMTNSNLVGCSTGSSAGFAPFKILFTNEAVRLYMSALRDE